MVLEVYGWVESIREIGKIRFVIVRNGCERIQLTLKRDLVTEELWSISSRLTRESAIKVAGREVETKIAKVTERLFRPK